VYVSDADKADDVETMHNDILKKMIVEKFGRIRSIFLDNLQCEDFHEEGILKLDQLADAISSCNDGDDEVE